MIELFLDFARRRREYSVFHGVGRIDGVVFMYDIR
jgi:hypothetical protein